MKRSPFSKYYNADLIFSITSDSKQSFDMFGNPVYEAEDLPIQAYLKPVNNQWVVDRGGSQENLVNLMGYIAYPLEISGHSLGDCVPTCNILTNGLTANASIKAYPGVSKAGIKRGIFTVKESYMHPAIIPTNQANRIIQRIQGVFIEKGGYN